LRLRTTLSMDSNGAPFALETEDTFMAIAQHVSNRLYHTKTFEDPSFLKWLLGSPKMALIFLPLRLYLGWQWLSAGIEKVNSPAWTQNGTALQGFWTSATKIPAGAKGAAVHYGWYHDFLQFMLNNHWYTWFARLIAFGETTIGILLIIGAFTGLVALTGAFMSFNFMLAGSASTNPLMFILALLMLVGWKIAGYIGADYYLLPAVGTPWQPGDVVDAARGPQRVTRTVGQKALGAASWIALFALAAVVAVEANNAWDAAHPVVGYVVALLAVLLAWVIGEAVLTATHNSRTAATPASFNSKGSTV
jgi:thiosulfate dehydrogenase (quinone) large subunit